MKAKVTYNGNKVWGDQPSVMGDQPTPLFSKSVEYIQAGERWCQVENWTLNGTVIGCDFQELENEKNKITTAFSNGFGPIEISQEENFFMPLVEIKNIEFNESDYIGSLQYTINFLYYPEQSFSGDNHNGYYGVINPSDSITYTENDDGILEMKREISAKGIMTDSNKNTPLNNAKNFIAYRKTILPQPFLIKNQITNSSIMNYYLVSSEESFNRITNQITLNQIYRTDITSANGNIINRYVISEDEEVGEINKISYKGEINAGKYGDMENVRNLYKTFKNTLNFQFLISEEITEDNYIKKLTYTLSFYKNIDQNNFPEIEDNFTISLSESEDSSLFSASLQGNIKANFGCIETRLNKVKNVFSSIKQTNFNFSLIQSFYDNFYSTSRGSKQSKPSTVNLQSKPLSIQYEINEFDNTISYSASFDDRYIPPSPFNNCINYEESIDINYSVLQKAIKEHYKGGKYICQNLQYNSRELITINMSRNGVETFVSANNYRSRGVNILNNLKNPASKEYDENPSFSKNEQSKTDSYSISKSYNTTQAFT
jgi:hypothetical protein